MVLSKVSASLRLCDGIVFRVVRVVSLGVGVFPATGCTHRFFALSDDGGSMAVRTDDCVGPLSFISVVPYLLFEEAKR